MKPTVFILNDLQVVDDAFLEDVHFLLNKWDIPYLFAPEELEPILQEIMAIVKTDPTIDISTRSKVYQIFYDRVFKNLHIVFCMSPVGEVFRKRILRCPSLVNCCTVDYFTEWPKEALHSVATNFLGEEDLESAEIKNYIFEICVSVHTSVVKFSQQFYKDSKRYNYVTPSSYLELLKLFIMLLKQKRESLKTQRESLLVGLKKLMSTRDSVVELQAQLSELKPYLENTAVSSKSTFILTLI